LYLNPPSMKKPEQQVHRGRRSGIPDCEPFQGYDLTPQDFSTSILVLGPVLYRSDYSIVSIPNATNNKKSPQILTRRRPAGHLNDELGLRGVTISREAKGCCCIISILFGSYKMMICSLKFLLLSHLVAMYMTVYCMVIDTQDMFTARKHTFPVISRGL